MGNAHPNIVPYEAFPCADGWLIIAVGNDRQFARLAELLSLEANPAWSTNAGRVADRAALSPAIAALTRAWQRDSLLARLAELGIPAGPINAVAEALADPQIVARGMVLEDRPRRGLRTPIRFSEAELTDDKPSPPLRPKG
jgi:crotonobetainyl-CoA:carnitine CoA-transferase CaiB-like acyl-CoA transferase